MPQSVFSMPAFSCKAYLLLMCIAVLVNPSRPTWWLLGMNSAQFQTSAELKPQRYREECNNLTYLVDKQKQLCSLSQNILKCPLDSREKAYVYAISAAGVAYSVTRSCGRGDLDECGCDKRVQQRPTKGRWEWGGCSEDLRFGEFFSKEFVDARESRDLAEGLMNLHNNEAGRRTLRKYVEIICKCHGVSGSCSLRVCWRRLADFRHVGDALKQKFEGASIVKFSNNRRRRKRLRPIEKGMKRPTKKDLVYLEESPDYCEMNTKLGVIGTSGRLCNKTSWGMDGCRLLCCGRGYQTRMRIVTEKCNCKFIWCCNVKCDVCNYTREEHYCN